MDKWKVEHRHDGGVGVSYAVVEKTDQKDWGLVINVPCPPFAMGSVGALVCTANIAKSVAEKRARLMAAAPELLDALERFMDMWNSGDSGRSSKRAQQRRAEMWGCANAAIAKVNGA